MNPTNVNRPIDEQSFVVALMELFDLKQQTLIF